ncbi:MAG: hypothetical protein ACRC0L_02205 [Angustibacter sp.]
MSLRPIYPAFLIVPLLFGCSSDVSLDFSPKNYSEAADLAEKVSDEGSCRDFQDFYAREAGVWTFECQIKKNAFIITITETQNVGGAAGHLDTDRKIGKHFVVHETETLGQARTMAALDTFPGVAYPKEFTSPPKIKKT